MTHPWVISKQSLYKIKILLMFLHKKEYEADTNFINFFFQLTLTLKNDRASKS